MPPRPPVTGTTHHPLPFHRLAPLDFERLCLWLVQREGYERAEHLGAAGSEGGRDVVAWKDGRRVVFQYKRVQAFTAAHARKEIAKLQELPAEEQPQELVFVVSQAVSAATRQAAREAWGDAATCHFWAGSELDARVKRHPDLVREFFQLPGEPAAPPPGFRHNLPYPSLGTLFQGRDEILDLLRERVAQAPAGRATAIAGKAVHGLGGVGKTRLAVEYAWRHAAEYQAALFVGAGSPADLHRNLAALCEVLDLPEHEAREDEVREAAVRRWLRDHPGEWLLILDNVDSQEAATAVDGLVKGLAGGHVLLTGRLARWGVEVEPLALDLLTEADAAAFLLARTASGRRKTGDDERHAVTLARELGGFPLALELAGAAIAEHRFTLEGYLGEWRENRDEVLAKFDRLVRRDTLSVAATWQTSIGWLSQPARRLLQRLAWLGPKLIPETPLDVPAPRISSGRTGHFKRLVLSAPRFDHLPAWLGVALGLAAGGAAAVALLQGPPVVAVLGFVLLLGLAGWMVGSAQPVEAAEVAVPVPAAPPAEAIVPVPAVPPAPAELAWQEPELVRDRELVPLPGGVFEMGSPEDEEGRDSNESPLHEVRVSPFACMRYPVTRRLYEAVVGKDPGWPEGEADDRPVNNVSWEDAVRFCNRWSEREGLVPCYEIREDGSIERRGGGGYRLPTEAEWEYACRAGTRTRWLFGDEEAELDRHAWYKGNSGGEPQPVERKEPNRWGLHDLHGNVWEWVEDWYGPYGAEPQEDPVGPTDGKLRVLRGGSFIGTPGDLRSALRFWGEPTLRIRFVGFRCVRAADRETSPSPRVDRLPGWRRTW